MTESEISLTIHGLDEFHQAVDGEVFAEKLTAFMKGLAAADEAANGRRRYNFLISDLKRASATACVRERVTIKGRPPLSGIKFFGDAIDAIVNDAPRARDLSIDFVKQVERLNRGVGKRFPFGEIKLGESKVIRIDDFLRLKAEKLLRFLEEGPSEKFFAGVAFGSFDGVLKEVDLRGETKRAVLILTAGSTEISCVVDAIPIGRLRKCLDRRAIVSGLARYSADKGLPERIEIFDVNPVVDESDFIAWRGLFTIPERTDEDWGDM